LGFIKNLILTESTKTEKIEDQKNIDSILHMKDLLYFFSTTTTGLSNALIFLDERKNVINNLDYYNYNPWKADWIYSKEYKNKRKDLIHNIRNHMDYKGEVSDDEDSIIKYDETQDELSEQVIKYNRESIKVEEEPNVVYDDKPMIFNDEIATGKVNSDNISEEVINEPIKKVVKSENRANLIKPIALNNMFLDNRLYYYNIYQKNKEILEKNNSTINYTPIFGSSFSQNNLLGEQNLIPPQNYPATFYNIKK